VLIYQSFSGDAKGSTGTWTQTGGSLSAAHGALFHVTNATAVITLHSVNTSATSGVLLKTASKKWGTSGRRVSALPTPRDPLGCELAPSEFVVHSPLGAASRSVRFRHGSRQARYDRVCLIGCRLGDSAQRGRSARFAMFAMSEWRRRRPSTQGRRHLDT